MNQMNGILLNETYRPMTLSMSIQLLALGLCIETFILNKLIFINDFHVNESNIDGDNPDKEGNNSPDFDVNDYLITKINQDLTSNTDSSARTNFQIEHQKDSNTTSPIKCGVSIQTNLTLNRHISD